MSVAFTLDPARLLRPRNARLLEAAALSTMTFTLGKARLELRQYDERLVVRVVGQDGKVAQVETTDPDELWERFAIHGLIPLEWVDDPRREFLEIVEHEGRYLTIGEMRFYHVSESPLYGPRPATLSACLAFAANAAAVAQAEALAREASSRLTRLEFAHGFESVSRGDRVRWRCGDRKAFAPPMSLEGQTIVDPRQLWTRAFPEAAFVTNISRRDRLCESGLSYAGAAFFERLERYRATWPEVATNPYEPLVELCELGYALDGFQPDGIYLFCPTVSL